MDKVHSHGKTEPPTQDNGKKTSNTVVENTPGQTVMSTKETGPRARWKVRVHFIKATASSTEEDSKTDSKKATAYSKIRTDVTKANSDGVKR